MKKKISYLDELSLAIYRWPWSFFPKLKLSPSSLLSGPHPSYPNCHESIFCNVFMFLLPILENS